jgi:hypothetical protein
MISVPATPFLPTPWTYEPIRFKSDITKTFKTLYSKGFILDHVKDIEIDPGKVGRFERIKKNSFDNKFYLCVNECQKSKGIFCVISMCGEFCRPWLTGIIGPGVF